MDSGHDEVFEELVSSRYDALLRCAYLLTGNRESARDLVQSALTKAYAKRFGVRAPEAMEQYVRRCIVTSHISAWRRHRGREIDYATPPEYGHEHSDHAGGVDTSLDVWRALRALPPRQRTAIVLRYFEDLPIAQVARLMDCTEASVKTHTSRGLTRLRADIGIADTDQDLSYGMRKAETA
jgi:RNA polymerase sigma-70 factor (sigma-E family)